MMSRIKMSPVVDRWLVDYAERTGSRAAGPHRGGGVVEGEESQIRGPQTVRIGEVDMVDEPCERILDIKSSLS